MDLKWKSKAHSPQWPETNDACFALYMPSYIPWCHRVEIRQCCPTLGRTPGMSAIGACQNVFTLNVPVGLTGLNANSLGFNQNRGHFVCPIHQSLFTPPSVLVPPCLCQPRESPPPRHHQQPLHKHDSSNAEYHRTCPHPSRSPLSTLHTGFTNVFSLGKLAWPELRAPGVTGPGERPWRRGVSARVWGGSGVEEETAKGLTLLAKSVAYRKNAYPCHKIPTTTLPGYMLYDLLPKGCTASDAK